MVDWTVPAHTNLNGQNASPWHIGDKFGVDRSCCGQCLLSEKAILSIGCLHYKVKSQYGCKYAPSPSNVLIFGTIFGFLMVQPNNQIQIDPLFAHEQNLICGSKYMCVLIICIFVLSGDIHPVSGACADAGKTNEKGLYIICSNRTHIYYSGIKINDANVFAVGFPWDTSSCRI